MTLWLAAALLLAPTPAPGPTVWAEAGGRPWTGCRERERQADGILQRVSTQSDESSGDSPWAALARDCPNAPAVLVMAAVPFSLVGGFWLVWLLGHSVSVATAVGFIALAGVAAEFGVVMLVYLENALKGRLAAGEPDNEETLLAAIREGAVLRVRPKATRPSDREIRAKVTDLLKLVQLLQVPNSLAKSRSYAAGRILKTFGGVSLVPGSRKAARQFVAMIAVGHDADPAVVDYVFELFQGTSAAGRRGWVSALVDNLDDHHIGLDNLTVPTLVIGSSRDRLLPIAASRRIAKNVPNLWSFVELGGGHCANLERPDQVNQHLRALLVGSAHSSTA